MQHVHVYFNLRTGLWSVRDPKTRKVIDHRHSLTLRGVRFVVSEASRQRVLRERRRAVHAWAVGTISEGTGTVRVTYNPYRCGTFTTLDGAPVQAAELVEFRDDGKAYMGRAQQ
jgi:hypothetical protein